MNDNFTITKEIQFDMGHRVPNHKSKCRSPHGHRVKVVACVKGALNSQWGESDEGMVMDFGDLKQAMMSLHDLYDHSFVYYEFDEWAQRAFSTPEEGFKVHRVPFIPTAENLSRHFFHLLAQELTRRSVQGMLEWVEVYETPTSVCRFSLKDIGR